MNITVAKVVRDLEKTHGWTINIKDKENFMVKELIEDTVDVINNILRTHKGIKIKN